jgi:hypothetical protein
MNNMTTNTTTNMRTNMTINTELWQEGPNPQLIERVVGEVRGIHHQDIEEQVPEVSLGFLLICSFTNSAATAFAVFDHSH